MYINFCICIFALITLLHCDSLVPWSLFYKYIPWVGSLEKLQSNHLDSLIFGKFPSVFPGWVNSDCEAGAFALDIQYNVFLNPLTKSRGVLLFPFYLPFFFLACFSPLLLGDIYSELLEAPHCLAAFHNNWNIWKF